MWIEIGLQDTVIRSRSVTPLAGVWIEIVGLGVGVGVGVVTPLAGVWIEIPYHNVAEDSKDVTPLAGVWIEIYPAQFFRESVMSHPSRVCGLK